MKKYELNLEIRSSLKCGTFGNIFRFFSCYFLVILGSLRYMKNDRKSDTNYRDSSTICAFFP